MIENEHQNDRRIQTNTINTSKYKENAENTKDIQKMQDTLENVPS